MVPSVDDGEETPKTPVRPKLGPRPPSPEKDEQQESYGREYYSMNTAQKLASSKPDRDKVSLPKARGGWTWILMLAAAAALFYWKPDTLTSAFATMKEWIFAQRKEIFSRGAGYGELPEDNP
jgi:hypothetical protein